MQEAFYQFRSGECSLEVGDENQACKVQISVVKIVQQSHFLP